MDPALLPYLFDDGMLHHPLIIVLSVDTYPGGIAAINELYRRKKAACAEAERNGDWWQYIFLHEKPYRVKLLLKARRKINDPRLAALLVKSVWMLSENIRQQRSIWTSVWSGLPDPTATMDEDVSVDTFDRYEPLGNNQLEMVDDASRYLPTI